MNAKGTFSHLGYNSNENDMSDWRQYGGTGVTITEDLRSRKSSHGADPTKLGCWTWIRIYGRNGEATVFVSAYRPCKNITGISTVLSQQERYFQGEGSDPDIHKQFIEDLTTAIGRMRDNGDHVVLGMDANEDIRTGSVTLALEDVGMLEGMISKHRGASVPATCATNQSRTPIDGIWISPGIEVL